jgi:hypothetical protein
MIRRGVGKKNLMEGIGTLESYCNGHPPALQFHRMSKELPVLKDVIKSYISSKGEWTDVSRNLLVDWYDNYKEFKRNYDYYTVVRKKVAVDLDEPYSKITEVNKGIAKWVDDVRFMMRYGMTKDEHRQEFDELKKMFVDYFNGTFDRSKFR